MNEGMMPYEYRCDDCEKLYDGKKTDLVYLQSEDGLVKVVCQTCLDTYGTEPRVIH